MEVSENEATPESSKLEIGIFHEINHPFWEYPHLWKPPYSYIETTSNYQYSYGPTNSYKWTYNSYNSGYIMK